MSRSYKKPDWIANSLDPDDTAAAKMLRALADCPREKRLDTLAMVAKVFIERPDVLLMLEKKTAAKV